MKKQEEQKILARNSSINGITLIALVITIIVLLILAGVTIATLFGNNGILTQSQEAVLATKEANAKEQVQMAWAACETEYEVAWTKDNSITRGEYFTKTNMQKYVDTTGNIENFLYVENGKSTIVYKTKSDGETYTFFMESNGGLERNEETKLNWSDFADTTWYDKNPDAKEFNISTAEELAGLAKIVNDLVNEVYANETFSTDVIHLKNDIDLKNMNWTPIGIGTDTSTYKDAFAGLLDGENHTISNVSVNNYDNAGLISVLHGEEDPVGVKVGISNLIIQDSRFLGLQCAGAFCGASVNQNIDGSVPSYINCKSVNNQIEGKYGGGIIGKVSIGLYAGRYGAYGSFFQQCFNSSQVYGRNYSAGICGMEECLNGRPGSGSEFRYCVNEGTIKSDFVSTGIFGNGVEYNSFANCINRGNLLGDKIYGIVEQPKNHEEIDIWVMQGCIDYGKSNSENYRGLCEVCDGIMGDCYTIGSKLYTELYDASNPYYVEGDLEGICKNSEVIEVSDLKTQELITKLNMNTSKYWNSLQYKFILGEDGPKLDWEA